MKTPISTTSAPQPAGSYSQGIVANGFLFTAGFGPQHPETGELPEGIVAQTTQTLRNLEAVLQAQGLDLSDVVKATVHITKVEDFPGFDQAYRELVPAPLPARTTVGSGLHGQLIEIDVIAALRQ